MRDALHALLARSRPIQFAAVKPLLGRSLNRTFDPTRFDCLDTGDFLGYGKELDVLVSKGEHDWEITLPSAEQPVGEVASPTAAAAPLPPQAPQGLALFTPPAVPFSGVIDYRDLLERGIPRIYLVPFAAWQTITECLFRQAVGEGTDRPVVFYYDLLRSLTAACERDGMMDAERRVKAVTFQVFKAGCLLCADGLTAADVRDFNWARPRGRTRFGDGRRPATADARVHRGVVAGAFGGARLAASDRRRPVGGTAVRPRHDAGTGPGAEVTGGRRHRRAGGVSLSLSWRLSGPVGS